MFLKKMCLIVPFVLIFSASALAAEPSGNWLKIKMDLNKVQNNMTPEKCASGEVKCNSACFKKTDGDRELQPNCSYACKDSSKFYHESTNTCVSICPGGTTVCQGRCMNLIDPSTQKDLQGDCTYACAADKPLKNGVCTACASGEMVCNGTCTASLEDGTGKELQPDCTYACPTDNPVFEGGICHAVCTNGMSWNGTACACPSNKPLLISGVCASCPENKKANEAGTACVCLSSQMVAKVLPGNDGGCKCPENSSWNGTNCVQNFSDGGHEKFETDKDLCGYVYNKVPINYIVSGTYRAFTNVNTSIVGASAATGCWTGGDQYNRAWCFSKFRFQTKSGKYLEILYGYCNASTPNYTIGIITNEPLCGYNTGGAFHAYGYSGGTFYLMATNYRSLGTNTYWASPSKTPSNPTIVYNMIKAVIGPYM